MSTRKTSRSRSDRSSSTAPRSPRSNRSAGSPSSNGETSPGSTPSIYTGHSAATAYARYAPLAAQIPDDELEHYNADLSVVPTNVRRALTALEPHLGPGNLLSDEQRTQIQSLPALVLALVTAAARVVDPASNGTIQAALNEQRALRRATLGYLEAASEPVVGVVPAERVRAIREGSGPLDHVRDGLAIAALFREFASQLAGKHPFTDAMLAQLEARSTFLLDVLAPAAAGAAPGAVTAPRSDAVKVRDGLWTLIVRAFDTALLLAARVWGVREIANHVPPLLTRVAGSTDATDAPASDAAGTTPATSPPRG